MSKMSDKLTKKQRKEMLKQRYGDYEEKPPGRMRTEKELMDDERIWEEH